ncbi:MAG: ribonuclease P protein component [Candidatus Colwellbacteria bacterium]|nr:ribonuclease P protein component [Candidatus Colwellbacteria bacterium]
MLAKKLRLPVNTFPARVKILYRGRLFTLKTSPNHLSYNRIGLIITKKSASYATQRNRLRRKVFDSFGESALFSVGTGAPLRPTGSAGHMDLLVLIKPIKLDADEEEKLFRELNLIKERLINGFDKLTIK